MSEPENCIECEHGRVNVSYDPTALIREWGSCWHGRRRRIEVVEMVRRDGRIIRPPWCPWTDEGRVRG